MPIKILLVGGQGSGKTSLRKTFAEGIFQEDQSQTIGIDGYHDNPISTDDGSERLQILEGGGIIDRGMITSYVHHPDVIVINVDLNSLLAQADPMKIVEGQISNWKKLFPQVEGGNKPKPVFILALNKCDLVQGDQIILARIQEEANKLGIQAVCVTSAKGNNGVTELFNKAAELAPKREQQYQQNSDQDIYRIPLPDKEVELIAATRHRVLKAVGKFLLGLLIIGAIVGLPLLLIFPPVWLATLLATIVVGGLTVGSVAGLATAALAALALIGTATYSFFKRSKTAPKEEKSKELELEMAPEAEKIDRNSALGVYPSGLPGQKYHAGRTGSEPSSSSPASPAPPSERPKNRKS